MFVPVRQITTPEEDVNQVHTALWDHQPPSTVQLDGTVMIMNYLDVHIHYSKILKLMLKHLLEDCKSRKIKISTFRCAQFIIITVPSSCTVDGG
jgi:hypothetical protein